MTEDQDYARGPGRHYGRGAVAASYAETGALGRICPNPACRAAVGDVCRWDDGAERKCPCPVRMDHNPDPEATS